MQCSAAQWAYAIVRTMLRLHAVEQVGSTAPGRRGAASQQPLAHSTFYFYYITPKRKADSKFNRGSSPIILLFPKWCICGMHFQLRLSPP